MCTFSRLQAKLKYKNVKKNTELNCIDLEEYASSNISLINSLSFIQLTILPISYIWFCLFPTSCFFGVHIKLNKVQIPCFVSELNTNVSKQDRHSESYGYFWKFVKGILFCLIKKYIPVFCFHYLFLLGFEGRTSVI